MVQIAYIDKDRNTKVYANKLVEADKEKYKFYCPNEDCKAEMSLSIYEKYSNTFRANMKGKKHIEDCWAKKPELNQEYLTNKFNTESFIENLMNSQNSKSNNKKTNSSTEYKKHKKLSTLKDIFIYCRLHDIDEKIQTEYIRNIFLDDRNVNFYNQVGVCGYKFLSPKLIEFSFDKKNNNNHFIFKYGNIKGILYVNNKSTMKQILDKLDLFSGRKPKNIRTVIATSWYTIQDENKKVKYIKGKLINTKQIIDVSSYGI
ncbi:hypothetical protein G8J24_05220 [Staphylococcus warneri]|uniref:Uncharacterized protein n=1 Tax=Staphylococcus warneri TaxID=1292 RepID=A0ABS9NES9_STAWA|nr:hypothetical protein [Staphylococcus warneri]MCG6225268.1 hypothetical protein [Staphylococcus warneri]MCG6246133.1 hypothetical protein [Staphylococcus warneri]MCG6248508.1 hypothetical protein [Staphylococcus warneri]MCG6250879.1 hypothetical protein [Staphylococcus warneri]